jgi:ankyrin repeat protein
MIAKANGELLDYDGNTAIHLACYNGFLDCLNTLSKHLTLSKMLDIINYDGKYF